MIVNGGNLARSTLSNGFISRSAVFFCQRFISTLQIEEDVFEESARPLKTTETQLEHAVREKEINITTCGSLFEKWRQERRYWKVSKSEIPFRVRYIDTGHQGCAADTPTVISLHGSPGTYRDFDPLTAHLHRMGVRVIAPNFPGPDLPPTTFRSTPEEKSEYVNDFLQALHVPRVDMLVCSSSAMFPGLFLSLGNKRFSPKSLVMLNPTTLEIPKLLHPPWLLQFIIRAYEFPFGYQITSLLGRRIAAKPELKKGSFESHFQSAVALMNAHIPKQAVRFQSLLDQNYPVMMAFSSNDKLIAKTSSYKMAQMMVDMEEIQTYDMEGKKENPGGLNPFRRVMAFENGTHFLLKTYPEIVCEAISSFLFHHLNNGVNVK